MADQPYDRVIYHGKQFDRFTVQRIQAAEKRLGYELTIVQGSYNSGVGASAGTHDGGGAMDLAPYDWERKCRILRQEGFAAWHRPALAGVWGEHIHCIMYDNAKLSSGARSQVTQYYAHKNGLASWGYDSQWRPNPIPHFKWRKAPKPVKPWGLKVNRRRINRSLRALGRYDGKTVTWMLNVLVAHLRKQGYTVKGWPKHQASVKRALRKYQKNRGLKVSGLLDAKTAKKLHLKSYWTPIKKSKKLKGINK